MAKDRIKPLFSILATGDDTKMRQEANKVLREIKDERDALARDERLVRELLRRYGNAVDKSGDRSAKIRETALALARGGMTILTPQQVIDYLSRTQGITFDVQKPASVAGTILGGMAEFKHRERNQFEFIGDGEEPS
jgi:hypothetical protein